MDIGLIISFVLLAGMLVGLWWTLDLVTQQVTEHWLSHHRKR